MELRCSICGMIYDECRMVEYKGRVICIYCFFNIINGVERGRHADVDPLWMKVSKIRRTLADFWPRTSCEW